MTQDFMNEALPKTETAAERKTQLHYERMIFLPVLGAIIAIWAVVIAFTLAERTAALERAQTQLQSTVSTLADFNQLAAQLADQSSAANSDRAAAIWRALLQYPAASIWVETRGVVSAGLPPEAGLGPVISATETRGDFSVHAVLPEAEALTDWRRSAWWRGTALVLAGAAFLVLTEFLARALRLRAAADREAAKAQERVSQLALHRVQLEQTVTQRTLELKEANANLGVELVERKAAESALREHDALLNAVTKSAAELLGSHNLDDAIMAVLELTGQTIGVGRAQLKTISTGSDGHLRSSIKYEWCAPGTTAVVDNPILQNLDITVHFPQVVAPFLTGDLAATFIDDVAGPCKSLFEHAGMRSFLEIPVLTEGSLSGALVFIDSSEGKRQWSWAETDTLKTLSGLIGIATTRARYVKELADANTIVQNSPTILYRLKGEPSLPMIYVSHNISKFGYDSAKLLQTPNAYVDLIDPNDRPAVQAAMARVLEKDSPGSAIEFRLKTGSGARRWVETRYTPVRDKDGRLIEIEGIMIDITERKVAEDKISLLARTDPLTGLANRATFGERLRQAFAGAKRGGTPFGLLYMDLDHFKDINDTLGHPMGDALLKEVAERLKECVRESDLVARLGGDEFAVLQSDMVEPAAAGTLASKIMAALSAPYTIDGNDLHVTISIGIAPYVPTSDGPDAMLSQADLALYRSKEEGRNRYRFHSDDLDRQVHERVTLADDLRNAVELDELELYYQPQVELSSGRIVGMEALIRWNHPQRGLLPPSMFLPIAEKTGTFVAVGHWVLDNACRQMKLWRDQGIAPPVIAINLSLSQLKTGRELVQDVAATIKKWGLSAADVEFDVTEATLAQTTWSQNDVLAQLRQLGARIAIDDFGTEYSSFDYLRTYDVGHLKIARSFIDQAAKDPERAATIRAIITLARELGVEVIVGGVETEEQHSLLVSIGSSIKAQGFYFSEPVASEQAQALLRSGSIHPDKP
jgi:diguanylate cyclase (GGDEF)-like protein/PAS domain S-box-containing protein